MNIVGYYEFLFGDECFLALCFILWVAENKYLKFDRNRIGSMANKFRNDENTVYVEYCRSCQSHSWCTHHDESKYHDTFLKLTEMMGHRMPQLEIVGNMVPAHLIPFKIAENKYIDSNTNKYVIFPHIGAFEVVFRGKILFSKKDTHTWPSLPSVVSKIGSIFDPTYQSPAKPSRVRQDQNGGSNHSNSNSFVEPEEDKEKKYKSQQKGFTLTDHFKMYRPKNTFQDKQWLTQKHQSEASMRQISEMGRLESRQKSDKSSQSKKTPSDLAVEFKLKEMLKTKGKVANDHGKKQMIIRLDSIQEQNLFQEGAGATHRTPEKSVKRKKMKEIDDQIDSLEKKFKNFENRVQDIHSKNKEFEQKAGSGEIEEEEKNKFKQIIQNRRQQRERNPSTKHQRESQAKLANLLADKTNKLQQYLNFSEQEKNDKLHRIYGEWKIIKQYNSKNKKLLKAKKQKSGEHSQGSSSSSESKDYSNSQSPSTAANIIPFKQKNEKMMEKKIKEIHKKLPKYSSIERYNKGNDFITKAHNSTEDNFYKGKNIQKSQESDFEGRISSQHPNGSKLIKKSINTLSMDALKSLAHPNLPRLEGEAQREALSPAAKASIGTINKRINMLEQRLKQHKAKGLTTPSQESHPLIKDKSISKKSRSDSESEMHERITRNINKVASKTNLRNSNASINTINTVKKNYPHQKSKGSNFSELARPETKKAKANNQQAIKSIRQQKQEWAKPHQSKRKQAKYVDNSDNDHLPAKLLKKNSVNSQSKLNLLRERIRKAKKEQQQSKNEHEDALGYDRDSSDEEYGAKGQYEYHPHVGRQSKPKERRFKDWKESSPVKTLLKSKDLQRKITVEGSQQKNKAIKQKQIAQKIKKTSNEQVRTSAPKHNMRYSHKEDAEIKETVTPGKIKKNQVKRKVPSRFEHSQSSHRREKTERDFLNQQQDQEEVESATVEESEEPNHQPNHRQQSKEERLRKTLGYFKAQEMCYRGAKTSQQNRSAEREAHQKNQQYNSLHNNSQNFSQENRQNGSKFENELLETEQRGLSKQNSEESSFSPKGKQVEKAKREKEEQSESGWKTSSNRSEGSVVSKEGEEECQEGEVKNSIDRDIELNNRIQEEEKSLHEQTDNNRMKTEVLVKDQEELPGEKRPQTTKQIYSQSSCKQLEAHPQNKQKDSQAQPQQIKANQQNLQKKAKVIKEKQADIESLIAKEYGFYLASKVSADVAKQIYANDSVAVRLEGEGEKYLTNTQEIQIHSTEITCFNEFKPTPQEQQQIEQSKLSYEEEGDVVEEEQTIDHPKNQKVSQDIVEKAQEKVRQSTQNNSPSNAQSSQLAIIPIVPIKQSDSSPVLKSNKTEAQSPQQIMTVVKSANNSQSQQQCNNVYADSKLQSAHTSKFVEMGVQKQLTLEVSIQTDPAFRQIQQLKAQSKKSTRRDASQIREPEESASEFQGTVRNNYLHETKSSFRREKKEILRAAITNQIRSASKASQMEKFHNIITNTERQLPKQEQGSIKMAQVYKQGMFINERSLEVELVNTKFHNFLKVLEILAERGEWIITRLFEDPKGILQEKAFGVWICKNFEWQCFVVDDYIAVDENSNPLFTIHKGNQKWVNVLEKALHLALGGYQQLQRAECGEIFTLLTGCNYLGVRIKQDPTKNSKVLQMIGECQRKNYIVHAEKRSSKVKESSDRQSVFYLLSVRRSNGEDQTLLELSQDDRESFWMRLSKFSQEFTKVQVLQLRVNHIFNHIDISTAKEAQMTVIQLNFSESGQGCVTLSYIQHIAPLYAYLYREEKSKVLKLIGQAKQKLKSHLFFECNFNEGRYFVFVQSKEKETRLSYFGQNQPIMRVTEEIHNDGLKNQVAEYLPVNQLKQSRPKRSEMQSTWNDWKYGKTPRLKDNFMQSKLREDFVQYILGHNRRKQVQS